VPHAADRTIPAIPLPAATLMLLRDSEAGLEVLMMLRNQASGFAAGAMVFPGGRLDTVDHALARRSSQVDDVDEAEAAFRAAAIRETFEECGILMARSEAGGAVLSESEIAALRKRHEAVGNLGALAEQAGLELCSDLLVPFAHWITPVDNPKRFDTRFFIAPAPGDQRARADGREAVEILWTTPRAALQDADEGSRHLVLATYMNLRKLGRFGSVREALEAARQSRIITVTPELVTTEAGSEFRIPMEADYGVDRLPTRKVRRA
jgi:8-oxo-dGTP pyrophosphatase MutT (NUDIX family)